MKRLSILVFVFLQTLITFSQNAGINSTGVVPNASAGLDVDFTDSGLLIPRLTAVQRDAIASPATSLLIFNSTTNCFQTWVGGVWNNIWCICPVPSGVTASASPNPICAGSTLTLTGGATDATAWSWTGPNAYTSTLQSPTLTGITTAGAGVYTSTAAMPV